MSVDWKPVTVTIEVPVVAFKGPHDTDASALRGAADRIEAGFAPGGSNVTNAVVKLLRDVAWKASEARK